MFVLPVAWTYPVSPNVFPGSVGIVVELNVVTTYE